MDPTPMICLDEQLCELCKQQQYLLYISNNCALCAAVPPIIQEYTALSSGLVSKKIRDNNLWKWLQIPRDCEHITQTIVKISTIS